MSTMTGTVRHCGGCGGVLEDWQPGVCSSQCGQAVMLTGRAMRILITGSRTWTDAGMVAQAIDAAIAEFGADDITVVHGACPLGADRMAGAYVEDMAGWYDNANKRLVEERHPADWTRLGKRAGFVRNAEMVKLGADVCLAFIRDGSRGASHTAGLAEKAGIATRRWIA